MGPVPNAPTAAPSLAPAHCPQFTSAGGADFRGAELIGTGLQLDQGTANTRPGWEQGDSPTGPRHSGVRISRAPTQGVLSWALGQLGEGLRTFSSYRRKPDWSTEKPCWSQWCPYWSALV